MSKRTIQQPPLNKITPISAAITSDGQQATNTLHKPRNKKTYVPAPLPLEGLARLPSVLAFLSISKTSFLNGVKEGRYPAGKLLSPRCRVWEVSSIRALVAELGGEQ